MNGDTNRKPGEAVKDEGKLEKIAQSIDPPGREVSDDELIDPGANIPSETSSGTLQPDVKPARR